MAKWIKGAINPAHKGMEQRAAKKAGETTHEYMEGHKDIPGAAGARARLGLRLEGMHHADGGMVDQTVAEKLYSKKKVSGRGR